MITDIVTGLAILRGIDPTAPIVTAAYILAVPAIKVADVLLRPGTEDADLREAGWIDHPIYGCYYYPTETITELKDVTGEGSLDPPPYTVTLPAPR